MVTQVDAWFWTSGVGTALKPGEPVIILGDRYDPYTGGRKIVVSYIDVLCLQGIGRVLLSTLKKL